MVISPPCAAPAGPARRAKRPAQLVLRGVDGGAGFGGFEAEVGEGGEGVGGGSGARGRRCPAEAGDAELALELVGDPGGELGTDSVGAADHRLVVLGDGAGELVGRKDREDREREAAADALDAGQRPEGVALVRRAKAEQRPGVLAHLELGEDEHFAADRADRVERFAAEMDEVTDAGDVDHRAVGGGFREDSGEARDHGPEPNRSRGGKSRDRILFTRRRETRRSKRAFHTKARRHEGRSMSGNGRSISLLRASA